MEGIVFAVGRLPVATWGGAEDVIGDLDAIVADVLTKPFTLADMRATVAPLWRHALINAPICPFASRVTITGVRPMLVVT